MALTKQAIIEIQEAAKYNHLRNERLRKEDAESKVAIAKAVDASRAKPKAEVADKKGK